MSMKIDLGKYVITSNSRSFNLNTKKISQSGENTGQEILHAIGYYRHLHELMRDVIRLEIDSDDIKTMQQLGEKIDLIAKDFAEKLNSVIHE
ncbi:hypothetical protein [Xenorhabdus taiwanensis]|uniref:DUF5405 family protein n=1 Tax=Xenorhabdus taiwanensis TaxID=3085177 RepID=A0ABM8JYG5_9GAMM|nr:DUF5405 family protein [Xenorhabdus sp. TCT-1]BET97741.1 DUF5405 family protein [Xenorhabdus sp. TCT-1]